MMTFVDKYRYKSNILRHSKCSSICSHKTIKIQTNQSLDSFEKLTKNVESSNNVFSHTDVRRISFYRTKDTQRTEQLSKEKLWSVLFELLYDSVVAVSIEIKKTSKR